MIATRRMSSLAGLSPTAQSFGANIAQLKEESEKEHVDEVRPRPLRASKSAADGVSTRALTYMMSLQDRSVVHYGEHSESDSSRESLGKQDEQPESAAPLVNEMAKVSI